MIATNENYHTPHMMEWGGTSWTIDAGAVATAKLADDAVATAKIPNDAVTNAKLANMAANTIKGSVAGGDPADLTGPQARSITGQKWVGVYDSGEIGTAVAFLDIPLGSFTEFKIRGTVVPNTAVADFLLYYRVSSNGGSSYDAGATDYINDVVTQQDTTVVGSATSFGTAAFLCAQMDTAVVSYPGRFDASFFSGRASGAVPAMTSVSEARNNAGNSLQIFRTKRNVGVAATHIRILTDTATAGIGVNSRIIVEGC